MSSKSGSSTLLRKQLRACFMQQKTSFSNEPFGLWSLLACSATWLRESAKATPVQGKRKYNSPCNFLASYVWTNWPHWSPKIKGKHGETILNTLHESGKLCFTFRDLWTLWTNVTMCCSIARFTFNANNSKMLQILFQLLKLVLHVGSQKCTARSRIYSIHSSHAH